MRALMVRPGPAFSVADVARGWTKGLRQAGCTVVDFNFDERLSFYGAAHLERDGRWVKAFDDRATVGLAAKGIEAAALEVWPDLVVIISGFFVPPAVCELLRARGMTVVMVGTESPYETGRELERAAYSDAVILNDPTHLGLFRDVNPRTWFLPAAYDPDIHCPGPAPADAASDFCFVGTGFASRVAFLEAVDWAGIDVALAGNWQTLAEASPLRKFVAHDLDECCPNDETVGLYRATKASLNLYRKEADQDDLAAGWAMSPREVELAATGTFFLREPRPEGDTVLPMLPVVAGPDDFAAQLRWWLDHDTARAAAAAAARAAVAERTFRHNAEQLLRLLDT